MSYSLIKRLHKPYFLQNTKGIKFQIYDFLLEAKGLR